MSKADPVVLFANVCPGYLSLSLACMRKNLVPLVIRLGYPERSLLESLSN